uniref:Ig-like domain-containing protein n=1 Tax=Hucho hucho TaxID=62062 RepID=A0A4W5RTV9_9TELE
MIIPGRDDDGAQYKCRAELDLGPEGPQPHPTVTSKPLTITVHYAPKFNCIDQYEVTENENHNLTCTVDANPSSKITWFKGQQEVDIPQSLTRENRGEYTLVTNNTHGEASHKLVIDVLYAPEFLLGNDTVVVSKGSNVSLNCSAEGNPLPEMKWNYTAALNVKLSTEGRQRTVRITAATSTNAGIYICTATNIVGTATRTTTVTMKGIITDRLWIMLW